MAELEQTLDSREVAEMVEKDHSKLLRDLRRYEEQFTEAKIGFSDFFRESEYKDSTGRTLPCYRITKKGCEFIAHKLTGTKGTIFTARYINRFHEMQEIISRQEPEPKLPWFIRRFRGKYIVLWRDFTEITGYDIENRKPRNWITVMPGATMIPGVDFNGWGESCNHDEFEKEYGFEYGEGLMMYFSLSGVIKVLRLILEEKRIPLKSGSCKMLTEGIQMVQKRKKEMMPQNPYFGITFKGENSFFPIIIEGLPICINIICGQEAMQLRTRTMPPDIYDFSTRQHG